MLIALTATLALLTADAPAPPPTEATDPSLPPERPFTSGTAKAAAPTVVSPGVVMLGSGLRRLLSEDEADYFAAMTARAARAVVASLAPKVQGCHYDRERHQPPVPALGLVSFDGLAPVWTEQPLPAWSFRVSCPAPAGTHRAIELAVTIGDGQRAMMASMPVTRSRRLAPDAVVDRLGSGQGPVDLRVGLSPPLGAGRVRAGLQRVTSIHLFGKWGEETKGWRENGPPTRGTITASFDDGELLATLDLEPLRELLKEAPAPPADRAPAAEGAAKPDREAAEADVVAAVWDWLEEEHFERMGPLAETSRAESAKALSRFGSKEFAKLLALEAPDVLASAVADFRRVARESKRLPEPFLSKRTQGERAFEGVHPAELSFSRVGWSRDGTQAVLLYRWTKPNAVGAELLFLKRAPTGWTVLYELRPSEPLD